METLQEITDRRNFLKATSAAVAAALSAGTPRPAVTAERVEKIEAKADTCILLWMAGGMASTDTF
ncbi:MAG: twin-arginine translocation signal domain-containing protein, partial [Pirellulales bacterium]